MHPETSQRKTVLAPRPAASVGAAAFAALLVSNVALAFGPWFVRHADTGPVAAGLWRIALAAPLIGAMAVAGGARPGRLAMPLWLALAGAGVAFAADLGSWHLGIHRTTLANATLFGNSAILIFPIYGFLAARTWPTREQALALVLAAIGAGLLMGRSYQLDSRHLAGDLLCILAGVLYTVYLVLMTRARATLRPLPALALSTAASVLPLLALALALGETIVPRDWWPLIGLALVSQVVGQSCMTYALGRLSPLVIGIALLIQPVVAAALGWVAYRERLGLADWIGAALVAAALVLIRGRGEVARPAAPPHEGWGMIDLTLDEARAALAPGIAANAAFDGWSAAARDMAADGIGLDHDVAALALPDAMAMIDAWFAGIDAAMLELLPAERLATMRMRERITALVEARLDLLRPHRESLRRALAILAMPHHLARAARLGWRGVDAMWAAAGDTATDYNHYTKRATLLAVYTTTVTVFLDDDSDEAADTRAFLARRIDGLMRFEQAKAGMRARAQRLPSLSRFVGRLRYPSG